MINTTAYLSSGKSKQLEKQLKTEKRRQAGISFPAPRKQDNVVVVRLNIIEDNLMMIRDGLKRLCSFFEDIDKGDIKIEETNGEEIFWSSLDKFDFSATIGFGKTFFSKLRLFKKCPRNLYDMPNHSELGDSSPYVLPQTDIILQLASNSYSVNRLVLHNDYYLHYDVNYAKTKSTELGPNEGRASDIIKAIDGWAKVTDVHTGFHRTDNRNLMGFYDGISNPHRLTNDSVWITEEEEAEEVDGTYMVFQKIEHDLQAWHKLDISTQEEWVGRSKATGLLLGTISDEDEKSLTSELHSDDPSLRIRAMTRVNRLIDEQRDPEKHFFDPYDTRYLTILRKCPISSHVRRINPRDPNKKQQNQMFRRGYLYMQEEFSDHPKSGLLFISFQKDIRIFEEMKKNMARREDKMENIGKASNLENYVEGTFIKPFETLTLGGGYYFVPPIPRMTISQIGEQYF